MNGLDRGRFWRLYEHSDGRNAEAFLTFFDRAAWRSESGAKETSGSECLGLVKLTTILTTAELQVWRLFKNESRNS